MSHKFLFDASFHSLLEAIDREFLQEQKRQKCECGGHFHQADYPRSPMGVPIFLRNHYESRLSLCCSDCRKRLTPQLVRFFGRRWFPAPFFLLISVLSLGINTRRLQQIKKQAFE